MMQRIVVAISVFVNFVFHFTILAQDCLAPREFKYLDVNNVSARIMNGGDLFWDWNTAHYEVPKGSGKHSIFSAAIWLGGIDDMGRIRVAAQTYRQSGSDFYSGPISDEGEAGFDEYCRHFDRLWKVNLSEIEAMREEFNLTGTVNTSNYDEDIVEWPGRNNNLITIPSDTELAPFVDFNNDGVYNVQNGDYPKIKGDQAIWWVMNDVGGPHTESDSPLPLGVEIGVMAYAFKSNDFLNDATFYDYTIINKSQEDLFNFRFGFFCDPDLGVFDDDFVGSNPEVNLGYVYNGDAFDGEEETYGVYGYDVPALGISFLNRKMHCFLYYNGNFSVRGTPQDHEDMYGYLSGVWLDGSPLTFGGRGYQTGDPYFYMFPSNPSIMGSEEEGVWSECSQGNTPDDRRFVMSTYALTLAPGQKELYSIGIFWADPSLLSYPCPDLTPLFEMAEFGKVFLDSTYTSTDNTSFPADFAKPVEIHPHPIHQRALIRLGGTVNTKEGKLIIYNASGRLVRQLDFEGLKIEFKRKGLNDGIYFYQAESNGAVIASGKLILE